MFLAWTEKDRFALDEMPRRRRSMEGDSGSGSAEERMIRSFRFASSFNKDSLFIDPSLVFTPQSVWASETEGGSSPFQVDT